MVPVTQGILRNKVSEMLIGDYIAANFKNGVYTAIGEKANTALSDFDSNNPGTEGLVYLIKTQKGVLIPNMIQIPSNTQTGMDLFYYLNKKGMITGTDVDVPEYDSVVKGSDGNPTYQDVASSDIADAIAAGKTVYYTKTDGTLTTDDTDPDIDSSVSAKTPVMSTTNFKARVRIPSFNELMNALTGNMEYTAHTSKTVNNFYNGGANASEMVVPRGISIGTSDQFGYLNVSNNQYATFSDSTSTYPARLILEFVDNEFSVDLDH